MRDSSYFCSKFYYLLNLNQFIYAEIYLFLPLHAADGIGSKCRCSLQRQVRQADHLRRCRRLSAGQRRQVVQPARRRQDLRLHARHDAPLPGRRHPRQRRDRRRTPHLQRRERRLLPPGCLRPLHRHEGHLQQLQRLRQPTGELRMDGHHQRRRHSLRHQLRQRQDHHARHLLRHLGQLSRGERRPCPPHPLQIRGR